LPLEFLRRSRYLPFIILEKKRAEIKMATINPVQFMQQVRSEVAKVAWPSRREVMLTTIMVFIMAALTATFFSLVDYFIKLGLTIILNGF
jgi:preprotein translocase subunit SecE